MNSTRILQQVESYLKTQIVDFILSRREKTKTNVTCNYAKWKNELFLAEVVLNLKPHANFRSSQVLQQLAPIL